MQISKSHIETVLFYLTIIEVFIISREGLHYNEYKYHETWLIYYMIYLLTGIAT